MLYLKANNSLSARFMGRSPTQGGKQSASAVWCDETIKRKQQGGDKTNTGWFVWVSNHKSEVQGKKREKDSY